MPIDKFGRYLGEYGRRGPRGEGFNLTEEGNYDMQQKRICNLAKAQEEDDAVSLGDLRQYCLTLDDKNFFVKKMDELIVKVTENIKQITETVVSLHENITKIQETYDKRLNELDKIITTKTL